MSWKVPNPKSIKKETKDWVDFLFPIMITIAIVVIIWRVYKAFKAAGNAAGETLGIAATAVKTGIPADRVAYIADLGRRLWDDGVINYGWLVPWYDYKETMFIDALNAMQTVDELTLLDQYYRRESSESLKAAINKALSQSDKAKVKPKTLAALLQMA